MRDQARQKGEDILRKRLHAYIAPSTRNYHTSIQQNSFVSSPYSQSMNAYTTASGIEITLSEESYVSLCCGIADMISHPQHSWETEYIKCVEREADIRKEHPSVKLAYEKYRTLLELVADGRRIT
jgi:hypothetical protein